MDFISTTVKFIEDTSGGGSGGGQGTIIPASDQAINGSAATGDYLSIIFVIAALFITAFGIFYYAINRRRTKVYGNHSGSQFNPAASKLKNIFSFACVAIGLVMLLTTFAVGHTRALANESNKVASVTPSITAQYNKDSGEIKFDEIQLTKNVEKDVILYGLNVEYLPEISGDNNCKWVVKVDGKTLYNDVANKPVTELTNKINKSTVTLDVSGLSKQTISSFLNKDVLKISYDPIVLDQKEAIEYAEEAQQTFNATMDSYDPTELFGEDKEIFKQKAEEAKAKAEEKIRQTTDEKEIAQICENLTAELESIAAEAEASAQAVVEEKVNFNKEQIAVIEDQKAVVENDSWMTDEDKADLNNRFDDIENYSLQNVLMSTSRVAFDNSKQEVQSEIESVTLDAKTASEAAEKEAKDEATENTTNSYDEEINKIDEYESKQFFDEDKVEIKDQLKDDYENAQKSIKAAGTRKDMDQVVDDFEDVIQDAKDQAEIRIQKVKMAKEEAINSLKDRTVNEAQKLLDDDPWISEGVEENLQNVREELQKQIDTEYNGIEPAIDSTTSWETQDLSGLNYTVVIHNTKIDSIIEAIKQASKEATKAKAVYDLRAEGGPTFTFYYDNKDYSGEGITSYLITDGDKQAWQEASEASKIGYVKSVIFDQSFAGFTKFGSGDNFTNMDSWFYNFVSVSSFSGFNNINKNVTSMNYTFRNCGVATNQVNEDTQLDLSDFPAENIKNAEYAFYGCNFSKIIYPENCFEKLKCETSKKYGCGVIYHNNAKVIEFKGTAFSSLVNYNQLFSSCSKLEVIDLSNWQDTRNVETADSLFSSCQNLKTIYANDAFNFTHLSQSSCFSRNASLVGGNGTKYDGAKQDSSMAQIDHGGNDSADAQSGYFTYNDDSSCWINYNLNGASASENPAYLNYFQQVKQGYNFTVQGADKLPDPVWDNFIFTGWEINGKTYKAGDAVKATGESMILKATWKPKEEAYVALTNNGTELEFHYDGDRDTYNKTYDLNIEDKDPAWIMDNIRTVNFTDGFANYHPTSCYRWFYSGKLLTSIVGIENLKTDKVTTVKSMFYKCSSMVNIDVSNFNTAKIKNMNDMFQQCSSLTTLDVSSFDISSCESANNMFNSCTKLKTVFCDIDWSASTKLATSKYMFSGCTNLPHFDDSKIDKTYAYPDNGENGYFTPKHPVVALNPYTGGNYLDSEGKEITEAKGNYGDEVKVKVNVTDTTKEIDKVTDNTGKEYVVDEDGFISITLSANVNISVTLKAKTEAYVALTNNGTELEFHYDKNRSTYDTTYDLNIGDDKPAWESVMPDINIVTFADSFASYHPTSCQYWFFRGSNLSVVNNINNLKTSKVKRMGNMFQGCKSLKSLDVSGFETSQVTTMKAMFNGCELLTTLDVSGFDISQVTNTEYMFSRCSLLEKISCDNNWSTSAKLDSSTGMFTECSKLPHFDSSKIDKTYAYPDDGASGYFTPKEPEAYVALTNNGTELEFHYDKNKSKYDTTYYLNTGKDKPAWSMSGITTVTFAEEFASYRPTSCYNWFYLGESLTTINGIRNLNTSLVTNMCWMFAKCYKLTTLDVSGFDTSNVENMNGMFWDLLEITTLDVSNFNLSSCTNTGYLFQNCVKLVNLNFNGFDTSNVKNMSYMFSSCGKLKNLDLSGFNTSNVEKMNGMFESCYSLTDLDISGFDISKVTTTDQMFYDCRELTTILCNNNWNESEILTSSVDMFSKSTKLPHYDSTKVDKTYAYPDNGETGYFTPKAQPKAYVALTNNGTELEFHYDGNRSTYTTTYDLNTGDVQPEWSKEIRITKGITTVTFKTEFANYHPSSCSYWFYNFKGLNNINGINNLKTDQVTNMYYMFSYCESLTTLDVSGFVTSKVENMAYMFYTCSSISILDLSGFDTSNVENMSYMFYKCSSLATHDLSNFDTSNVENMAYMFYGNSNLTDLNLSNFHTSKVNNMQNMFYECKKLKSIDVSGFETGLVTKMSNMFKDCSSLTTLDVSNFDISSCTQNYGMFSGCSKLETILCDNDWSTSAKLTNSSSMFYDCMKLPHYNSSKVDKTYAYPDNGETGYFTKKAESVAYVAKTDANTLEFHYDGDKGMYNTTYDLNEGDAYPKWSMTGITTVTFTDGFANYHPTSCHRWFNSGNSLTTIKNIKNLNTDKVKNMRYMFYNCTSLIELDVSGFDTSQVERMDNLFFGCSELTDLDVSDFDTSNVTNTSGMFSRCSSIEKLDVSNFKTSRLENTKSMFANCSSLKTILCDNDWSIISSITSSDRLFSNCDKLPHYDSSKVDKTYAYPDNGSTGYFTPTKHYDSSDEMDFDNSNQSDSLTLDEGAGLDGLDANVEDNADTDLSNKELCNPVIEFVDNLLEGFKQENND